jgi:hypothetical protein
MDGDVIKPASKEEAKLAESVKAFLEQAGASNVQVRAVGVYDIDRDVSTIRLEITADVR